MGKHARHPARLWAHHDFLRLWGADTVSQIGTMVSAVALPLVAVKTLHASTFEVGLLTAAETAAFLLVGLPAGAWVDRVRRRPVMVGADWGRFLLLASVPVAAVAGVLTIGQLYLVALMTGVLTVFFDVAYQSYLPSLVGRDHLVEGNAKLESSRSIAQVGGPSLGGFLVQLFGAPYAVAADAVSYLLSALGIGWIRKPEPSPELPERRHLGREISEGLRFVFSQRLLWAIAGSTATSNMFSAIAGAVWVVFLARTLALSAGTIGLLLAAGSVGGIAGALGSSWIARRIGSARTIWGAMTCAALGGVLPPLTQPGWRLGLFAAGMFVFSFAAVVYNVAQVSFRQALCPERLLGRMNATMRFLVWGTMPLGGVLGGAIGTALGPRGALWVAAAGGFLAPLWTLLSPMRRMRDMPSHGERGDGTESDTISETDEERSTVPPLRA